MTVRFETTEFEFSHGKKPRGEGSWAFFFGRGNDMKNCHFFSGKFSDCKKAAMTGAKEMGFTVVRVAP